MTVFTYFEPLSAGHCAYWAQMVLSAAARDSRISRVQLQTSAKLADRLADVISETKLDLTILSDEQVSAFTDGSLLGRGRAQWSHARDILTQQGGRVFLPFFDHAIYGSILDRRPVNGKISGIIFRPPNDFGYAPTLKRQADALRRWGTYIAARRPGLGPLFTLDEGAAKASGARLRKLVFLADPAPDTKIFNNTQVIPRHDGRRWFLVFGALAERKGVFQLLEAARRLSPQAASRIGLRFVGKLDPADSVDFISQLETLKRTHPALALELDNRFVSDDELTCEISACDVVLAPYQNHIGSSGVVLWAAAAGKRLVCQNTGAMGHQVAEHKLGLGIDCTDPDTLSRALVADIAQPNARTLLATHTAAVFQNTILKGCLQ